MRILSAALVVFVGGFIMMVLEIIGARYLAKDFGSSFHVWVSQIGVVLIALALGYYVGGAVADRWQTLFLLAGLLAVTGVGMFFIPEWGGRLLNKLIERHPPELPVPLVWQKADPVIGSALLFLIPCMVLAMLSPFMIRMSTRRLSEVGRSSGLVIAAGTLGSIAGVFVSGFVLIEHFGMITIFRFSGVMTVALGVLCGVIEWNLRSQSDTQQQRGDAVS